MRKTDPIPVVAYMHYVYVAPVKDESFDLDLTRLKGSGYKVHALTPKEDSRSWPVRRMVAFLCDDHCLALIVPDDYHRHTEVVERTKICARHMGIEVLPVTRFLQHNKPVAASAVPATQHPAAAGKTTESTAA